MDVFAKANSIDTMRVIEALSLDQGIQRNVRSCPWHEERTPSLHIFEGNRGVWCFGCNRGGSNIDTVMANFDCTEREAIQWFRKNFPSEVGAEEDRYSFGYDLKAIKPTVSTRTITERVYEVRAGRIAEVNRLAGRLFVNNRKEVGGYLHTRGISPESAKVFGLGYAPKGYSQILTVNGVSKRELYESGMVLQNRNGKDYEPFAHRLMFPIIKDGLVYGFTARAMADWQKAKYINSPDSELYHKKEMLYGWHIASNSSDKYVIIVEGNTDVIALYQAGFDSVVATSGTAFTIEQAKLINSLGKKIYLMFDGDRAGKVAMGKAYDLMGGRSSINKIEKLDLPTGYDPDTFIQEFGKEKLEGML